MRAKGAEGRNWRNLVKRVIEKDRGICHACRAMGCHAVGADSADHHPVPYSECAAQGVSPVDMRNLRAIHHKPCPWCGVRCNDVKKAGSMEAFRLKWERKTGRKAVNPQERPNEPEGREW